MSYRRTFTKTIAVNYSGSVSYPASQNGGSVSYSGTEYEQVEVEVIVDTSPFDSSIQGCNASVGMLTGAVAASETAQVASIRHNAAKIGSTVVAGFFKTVQSEISQQIMELKSKIDATLIHLNTLAKRCIEKQFQMEQDYQRLSKQYLRVFKDLDKELKNRIYELDREAFAFKTESDQCAYRMLNTDIVTTTMIGHAENARLEAMIGASLAKRAARDTMQKINRFLHIQKKTDCILEYCLMHEDRNATYYLPVCYLETEGPAPETHHKVFYTKNGNLTNEQELITYFRNSSWNEKEVSGNTEQLAKYFYTEVGLHYNKADHHGNRVKEYISQLFNINHIQTR